MNQRIFFNYIIVDPTKPGNFQYEGLPFALLYEPLYVGKGLDGRWKKHFQAIYWKRQPNPHLQRKLAILTEQVSANSIIVSWQVSNEEDAFETEVQLIAEIGRLVNNTGPLLNITEGGEGAQGVKHSKASRKAMSDAHAKMIGDLNPFFGKRHNEKSRLKMKEAALRRGNCLTPEGLKRSVAATVKRHQNPKPETYRKISEGLKRAWARRKANASV